MRVIISPSLQPCQTTNANPALRLISTFSCRSPVTDDYPQHPIPNTRYLRYNALGNLSDAGRDHRALAEALRSLMRDPNRRKALGESARKRARALCDTEQQLNLLHNELKRIVK